MYREEGPLPGCEHIAETDALQANNAPSRYGGRYGI